MDYFIVARGRLMIDDLYSSRPDGPYYYSRGWNIRAYVAYGALLQLPLPCSVTYSSESSRRDRS